MTAIESPPPLPAHLDQAPELAPLFVLSHALTVAIRSLVAIHHDLLDPEFDEHMHHPQQMLAANVVCNAMKTRTAVARYYQDVLASLDLDRR